ncbi:MBL fold metallo-hydrolase [Mangrovicella endophytica]|uniref:MBL fold metallo-hydrolase n=1 Tax=Mangrovicella endophytica TaxID=2066697 RepID=UPI000C9E9487|nr:MBL fold metallo-hydrolase [Mangrovicella endophytica]
MIKKPATDRRSALKLAAAAAALAAGAVSTSRAGAQAQKTAAPDEDESPNKGRSPNFQKIPFGDARLTVISDGIREGEGPHPTFGANQPAEAVAALMRENYLPETRFSNGFNPVLIELGDQLILIDTGMGAMGRENGMGRLTRRMQRAGHKPEDVDVVVLTHLHGDHIGGLMEDGQPAFPNARYVVGKAEYDFWTSDAARSGKSAGNAELVTKNVVPLKDKITFIAEGDEVVPGLTAMEAFGHTPGHMIFELKTGDKRLWLTADTANHFVASLQRPDWEVAFDMDKAMAAETRHKVFDRVAEERIPFIGYHMPFPSIGFAARQGEGYRFIPLTYQFDVKA